MAIEDLFARLLDEKQQTESRTPGTPVNTDGIRNSTPLKPANLQGSHSSGTRGTPGTPKKIKTENKSRSIDCPTIRFRLIESYGAATVIGAEGDSLADLRNTLRQKYGKCLHWTDR